MSCHAQSVCPAGAILHAGCALQIVQNRCQQALNNLYVPAPCREQIQHIQREPHSRLPESVPPGYHKHVGMVDELEEVHPMEGED